MTAENGRLNSSEEMKCGDEALAEARHLAAGGFFRGAVSRAYYAAYHWARALLVARGMESKTHRGTIQLLNLHFVKDGHLGESTAADLAHLETYRELSDYTATASFTEDEARAEIARAERFVAACRRLAGSLNP